MRTYFEDFTCKYGESINVATLIELYGHERKDWKKIIRHPKNNAVAQRYAAELQDSWEFLPNLDHKDTIYIPIPWRMGIPQYKVSTWQGQPAFEIRIPRKGPSLRGKIEWIQTLYEVKDGKEGIEILDPDRHGWSARHFPEILDDKPFYFSDQDYDNKSWLKNEVFGDSPSRLSNVTIIFTTSLGVVTDKRVRLYETLMWVVRFRGESPPLLEKKIKIMPNTDRFMKHIAAIRNGTLKTAFTNVEKAGWCIEGPFSNNWADYAE